MLADAYRDAVRRWPLLGPEVQQDLAVRYAETRDPRLRDKLVRANLRLVLKIAGEYSRHWHEPEDLVQEGNAGLILAVEKYDPSRAAFTTCAAPWIRSGISYFLLRNWRLVRLGTTQAQRRVFHKLARAQKALGPGASDADIAAWIRVPEAVVTEMRLRLGISEVSMSAPASEKADEDRLECGGLLATGQATAEEQLLAHESAAQLRRVLASLDLDPRERVITERRLLAEEPATHTELARAMQGLSVATGNYRTQGHAWAARELSRSRVQQIEARLLARIGKAARQTIGGAR